MAIYALADTHLSLSTPDKAMDVFGPVWENSAEKISKNWREVVGEEDTVLISGDISWATYIDRAVDDFKFLANLPGRKIISRGNHDYWWTSIKKMNEFFDANGITGIEICRTNVVEAEGALITGTRGWMLPQSGMTEHEKKVYDRELERLKLCVREIEKADPGRTHKRILMIHYPPVTKQRGSTEFSKLADDVFDVCVYGHLHGPAHSMVFEGTAGGSCRYVCTAADYLRFKPVGPII